MKGVDQIVSYTRAWHDAIQADRQVTVSDTSGKIWKCDLHPDWEVDMFRSLQGRVADLKAAYKQLPLSPAQKFVGVVAVKKKEGGVDLFRALSLMFGQTAAVYSFLRFSRALAALASKLLNMVIVEFFDDFTQLDPAQLGDSGQESLQ